jgi:hypothetical protein
MLAGLEVILSSDMGIHSPRRHSEAAKRRGRPDYKAAKAGGMDAAARLVLDIMGKAQQEKLRTPA